MPNVRYQNHEGESVTLHGDGISFMDLNVLRSYKWNYSVSNRPNGMGGTASGFSRNPTVKTISVGTHAESLQALHDFENRIHAVTEPDIIANEPGKLYVDDQYIVCYIVEGNPVDYVKIGRYAQVQFGLLVIEPYWCSETTTVFNIKTSGSDATARKFPYKFPYRYTTSYANSKLDNLHYAECPMIITIYGPIQNPSLTIADTTYNVSVQVATGSRLVIDQTRHTINIVNSIGQKTNVFNSRNKQYDIFKPLPPGESVIQHNGEFKFAVSVIQQRSGMLWTA